jgi:hypothetical protein
VVVISDTGTTVKIFVGGVVPVKELVVNVDKLVDNETTAYIAGLYGADGSNE